MQFNILFFVNNFLLNIKIITMIFINKDIKNHMVGAEYFALPGKINLKKQMIYSEKCSNRSIPNLIFFLQHLLFHLIQPYRQFLYYLIIL